MARSPMSRIRRCTRFRLTRIPCLSSQTFIRLDPALFQKWHLFQKSGFCSKSRNQTAKISVAVPDCHLARCGTYSRIFQQNGVLIPVQFRACSHKGVCCGTL